MNIKILKESFDNFLSSITEKRKGIRPTSKQEAIDDYINMLVNSYEDDEWNDEAEERAQEMINIEQQAKDEGWLNHLINAVNVHLYNDRFAKGNVESRLAFLDPVYSRDILKSKEAMFNNIKNRITASNKLHKTASRTYKKYIIDMLKDNEKYGDRIADIIQRYSKGGQIGNKNKFQQ